MIKKRSNKKHPTIVLGIIHKEDKVILIKRREKDTLVKNLIWAFPGGKMRVGETPDESLIREIKEEVGLNIKKPKLLFIRIYPGTRILQRFYDCVPIGSTITSTMEPDEVEEIRWVKADSVQEYFASDMHPFILGFLNGLSAEKAVSNKNNHATKFEA